MKFLNKLFGKKAPAILTYEDFWNWFLAQEQKFFQVVQQMNDVEKNFFDKLSPKLNQLNEDLFFLTGMFDDHTAELIITPEGSIKNIVFAEEIVAAAPVLKNWKFTACKPASMEEGSTMRMGPWEFSINNISFYANDTDAYPDEIDLVFVYEDFEEENKSNQINGTFIFLENYLGELEVATGIDEISVISPAEAQKELIHLSKLNDYLTWRQKEFVEKYEGKRYDTENDSYSIMEAQLKSGNMLIATINSDLLAWDSKASHPWILVVAIKYGGQDNNGMPDQETYELLGTIGEELDAELKDFDGYLNIGRQTAENEREIYYACKDFRMPSKLLPRFQAKYGDILEITFEIYKDKYWQSFERFVQP